MNRLQGSICTAIGALFGFGMLLLACREAGAGQGTYIAWALASLLGVAIGTGSTFLWPLMFILPPLQWGFLGFCLGKMLIARRRAWFSGITAIGMTYVVAGPIGLARLPAYMSSDEVYAEVIAGAMLGVILIIGAVGLRRFTPSQGNRHLL